MKQPKAHICHSRRSLFCDTCGKRHNYPLMFRLSVYSTRTDSLGRPRRTDHTVLSNLTQPRVNHLITFISTYLQALNNPEQWNSVHIDVEVERW